MAMSNQTSLQQLLDLVFNFILVLWRIMIGSGINRNGSRQERDRVIIASGWWQGLWIMENLAIFVQQVLDWWRWVRCWWVKWVDDCWGGIHNDKGPSVIAQCVIVELGSRDRFRFYGWGLQTLDCDWFVVETELNCFIVLIQLHRTVYLQPVISQNAIIRTHVQHYHVMRQCVPLDIPLKVRNLRCCC